MRPVTWVGPQAPHGALFCTICSMTHLQRAQAFYAAQLQAAMREDGGELLTLDTRFDGNPVPQVACAWGIFGPTSAPAFGGNGLLPLPVPVCWAHMFSLELKEGGALAAASPAEMAALNAQVPLLGQRKGGGRPPR